MLFRVLEGERQTGRQAWTTEALRIGRSTLEHEAFRRWLAHKQKILEDARHRSEADEDEAYEAEKYLPMQMQAGRQFLFVRTSCQTVRLSLM